MLKNGHLVLYRKMLNGDTKKLSVIPVSQSFFDDHSVLRDIQYFYLGYIELPNGRSTKMSDETSFQF